MDVAFHTVFVGREESGETILHSFAMWPRSTMYVFAPLTPLPPQDIYCDRKYFQTQHVLILSFDLIIHEVEK
jgi:hypothetical protein